MDKILFINACVRSNSRTLELAKHVLSKLSGEVEEVKLYDIDLSPLDLKEMHLRDDAAKSKDFSNGVFSLAKQFANAETIVVAAPYWDLMFPAVLKCYFEKITVNGLTFCYGENGIPKGLCKGKKLIYVTTSGGPIKDSFGYDYVTALAKNFYGIPETVAVRAMNLDVMQIDAESVLKDAYISMVY